LICDCRRFVTVEQCGVVLKVFETNNQAENFTAAKKYVDELAEERERVYPDLIKKGCEENEK